MKRKFKLICKYCGSEFYGNASNVNYCENCYHNVECSNLNCHNIVHVIFKGDNETIIYSKNEHISEKYNLFQS